MRRILEGLSGFCITHFSKSTSRIPCRSFHASVFCNHAYKPLRPKEIRLLDLQPGNNDAPIQCALRNVSLDSKPYYESLSYCWGLRKEDKTIQCDDGAIPVTRDLFSALQQLRCEKRARTLWIDALSINQADLDERGKQVGMMKDIFQLSNRTVVWLGKQGQDSARAMLLARQLAKISQECGATTWRSYLSSNIPPLYDPVWSAFAALLQRPWWHRAWVVQEASVAKDILVVCEDESITWDELMQAIHFAVDLGVFIAYGGSTTFQAFSLFQARANFQSHYMPSLHEVLLQNRSFLATDPRDNVYGLLALADQKDVKCLRIKPDYHMNTQELFETISISLLKRSDLGAFHGSGIHNGLLGPEVPSWVSDWTTSDPSISLGSSELVIQGDKSSHTTTAFCASGPTVSSPVFDDTKSLLGLEGVLVDQISTIGALSRTRYLRHVSHMFELFVQCHDVLEQLKDWETVACVHSKELYPTGEKHREAYWHTLCAGRVPLNTPTARHDPRYKYYVLIRSLRRFVRLTIRWFPRSSKDTWYNRFFYTLFQGAWRAFGLTPAKIQRIGFPPESRLSNYRRMVRTKQGYLALVPRHTKEGDHVVLCKGGKLPLVVRKNGENWLLVGESYVHGMMNGEAWDETKCEQMWFE